MISTASRWTTLFITTCFAVFIAARLVSCGGGSSGGSSSASVSATPVVSLRRSFKAQVWADNWFSLYVGENFVGEDSVPITTER